MKKRTFSKLKVNLLTIDDLHSLVKTTCERAIIVSSLYYDNLYKLLSEMRSNNDKMAQHANLPIRIEWTGPLNEMNVDRIASFEEIKREVHFNLIHRLKSRRVAAHALHLFFEPYWNFKAKNPNIQSEIYNDLLTKYHTSPDTIANVSVLGLEKIMSNLESTNSRYDTLIKARSREIDPREITGKQLKHEVIKNYMDFCMAIEDIINFQVCPVMISLFHNLDEIRKKYSKIMPIPEQNSPQWSVQNKRLNDTKT